MTELYFAGDNTAGGVVYHSLFKGVAATQENQYKVINTNLHRNRIFGSVAFFLSLSEPIHSSNSSGDSHSWSQLQLTPC